MSITMSDDIMVVGRAPLKGTWTNSLPLIDGSKPKFWLDFPADRFALDEGAGLSPLSLTQLGSKIVSTGEQQFIKDGSGGYKLIPANGLRASRAGLLDRMVGGNKCICYNANPTDLTGVAPIGDVDISVVDDSAALALAGLDAICTSGKVFKVVNASSEDWGLNFNGPTGNTNKHSMSCFARTESGAQVKMLDSYGAGNVFTSSGAYTRLKSENYTPGGIDRSLGIRVSSGGTAYVILPQLEEYPYVTEPIVTNGSAVAISATRTNMAISPGSFAFVMDVDVLGFTVSNFCHLLRFGNNSNTAIQLFTTTGTPVFYVGANDVGVSVAGQVIGTATIGRHQFYGVVADNYFRMGNYGVSDGSIVSDFSVPAGIDTLSLDGRGLDSSQPRATKYTRRFALFQSIGDPEAAFFAAKAIAEAWAA